MLRREDLVEAGIAHDPSGNDLLQEFATTLKEGDRPVGLCNAVVWLVWFGDRYDFSRVPWVGAIGDAAVEQVNKAVRGGGKSPLDSRQ